MHARDSLQIVKGLLESGDIWRNKPATSSVCVARKHASLIFLIQKEVHARRIRFATASSVKIVSASGH